QQPDLNWRNPQVEKAAFGAMRFWLDRGIAGFRLDAIPTLFEDPKLQDDPETGGLNAQGDPNLNDIHTNNLPEVHDVIRRMRTMAASYPGDRLLIGETYLPNTAELDKWYGGAQHDELHLPMDMLLGFSNKLDAAGFRKYIEEAQTQLHGSQPLFVFDNHDNIRSVDRYAPADASPQDRDRIAKLLATVLLTTPATALLYQGEELGMDTATPVRREDVKDPIGVTGWPKEKGRDGERTPMQWTPGAQAGFSTNAETWLPIPADAKTINVEIESRDPQSQLTWYERLIALRRTNPALHDGTLRMLDPGNADVLSYLRSTGSGASVLVAINFTAEPRTIVLDLPGKQLKPLLADGNITAATTLTLPPYASYVAEVK
ncbi:MAG: alpha-amylase family glycosyl hydrolase, partial [Janthinobacterium lividum]